VIESTVAGFNAQRSRTRRTNGLSVNKKSGAQIAVGGVLINSTVVEHSNHSVRSVSPFQWWDYIVFITLCAAMAYGIAKFIGQWCSVKDLIQTPVSYLILSAILAIVLINTTGRWFLLLFMKRPIPMSPGPNWKVAVVTTFVSQSEPISMLEETLKSLVSLDYPHDTWVLDESDDDEVKALCRNIGVHHYSRKSNPEYQTETGRYKQRSKHGNYNAWLDEIGYRNYDILSAFDPDHVPQTDFLSKILGYFDCPNVGYVQVAQAYYNQSSSFIARGAAEETYAYYSSIEMSSYAMGYPIIIGSHNTHRLSALQLIGGIAAHDADDLLLTRHYRNQAWQGVYVPEILARGITPVDWPSYLGQQRRWARSVLDLKLRAYPGCSEKIHWSAQMFSLLHGLTYLHKSLILIVLQLLLIYLLLTGESPRVLSSEMIPNYIGLWLVLLVCEFYRQRFYLDWTHEWGTHWRVTLLQMAKSFYMLFALFDVVTSRSIEYELTVKSKSKVSQQLMLWPNAIMALVTSLAWFFGIISGHVTNPVIHFCAFGFISFSIALLYSESFVPAEPFDKSLLDKSKQIV